MHCRMTVELVHEICVHIMHAHMYSLLDVDETAGDQLATSS